MTAAAVISVVPVEAEPVLGGVALTAKPPPVEAVPIACARGAGALRRRIEDWRAVLAHVSRREAALDGVRLVFDPVAPFDELMRLAAAEQDCCRFFAFAFTVDTPGIALEVTAPSEVLPIVQSGFGTAA
jgi:hypothetical protein